MKLPIALLFLIELLKSIFGPVTGCTIHTVDADLQSIQSCIKLFEINNKRLPTSEEGLQILVERPRASDLPRWSKLANKVPLDPWGHPYQYLVPAPGGVAPFGIYSYGKDGISKSGGNDPDDPNTWNELQPGNEPDPIPFVRLLWACAISVPVLFLIFYLIHKFKLRKSS